MRRHPALLLAALWGLSVGGLRAPAAPPAEGPPPASTTMAAVPDESRREAGGKPARTEDGKGPPELRAEATSCALCGSLADDPLRRLTGAEVDSLGSSISAHNTRLLARTDSLYKVGAFGETGSDEARRTALAFFMLRARNGIDLTAELASTRGRLLVVDEASLSRPFGRDFLGATVYPLRFLERGVAGRDGFCMAYDTPDDVDELSWIGGVRVRLRSDTIEPDDEPPIPALVVRIESKIHKSVDMVFEERYCGRVRREMIVDRGDTLELVSVYDVEGMFARKAGIHRLSAILFWRSVVRDDEIPAEPRIGACAYFPHIHIDLPIFLPSLGLDDLRDFDIPLPVIAATWYPVGESRAYDWVRVAPAERGGIFDPWDALGPRPRILDERYPDL